MAGKCRRAKGTNACPKENKGENGELRDDTYNARKSYRQCDKERYRSSAPGGGPI